MVRFSDDDESRPPEIEVFITDGDGPGAPHHTAPRRIARLPMSAGRRLGIIAGVVAVFAFGVVVGRGTLRVQPGVATGESTTSVSPNRHSGSAATSSVGGRRDRSSGTPTAVSSPIEAATVPPTSTEEATGSWPLVPGACGRNVPKPLIEAAEPLTANVGIRLVTGGDPAPVSLADRTVGSALFEPDATHYVADIASVGNQVVLLIGNCDGAEPGRVFRATGAGKVADVALPDDVRRVALIHGGQRPWVAVAAGSYGFSTVSLVAADGFGGTVTLPTGFEPLSAEGQQIVGQYASGGMPLSSFGIFDLDSGKVVTQFGDVPEVGGSVATNAFSSGDYLIAAPWVCESSCRLTRYQISTGEKHSATLDPASDRILSTVAVAISPDGAVAAIALYNQPLPPAPFLPYEKVTDGGQGMTRVGLVDLDDGTVRALPGLAMGSETSPGLAFSPDGEWLVVAVGAGYKTRLLLYTADGAGPYDPQIEVPGLAGSPTSATTTER